MLSLKSNDLLYSNKIVDLMEEQIDILYNLKNIYVCFNIYIYIIHPTR